MEKEKNERYLYCTKCKDYPQDANIEYDGDQKYHCTNCDINGVVCNTILIEK